MKITQIGSCMVFGSKTAADRPSKYIKDEKYIWVQSTCSSVLQCTCHQTNHPQRWTMLTIQEAIVLVQVYSNVLATNAKQGSPIQNLLWPNFKAELTSSVNSCPDKRTWFFSHNTTWLSRHGWDKFCGFIHYNVQYVMYIVAYVILKLQFDLSLTFV
jgi:hypothetical protein